jgi:hypothetical protein
VIRASFLDILPLKLEGACDPQKEGAGNAGRSRTRSLVCKMENTRVSHHRHAETSGIPCAMVLTVSSALSLVTGLCCHHHPCDAARIVTSLNASVGASGPHDFVVRSHVIRLLTCLRPSHSLPRFVTIASRPSCRTEQARYRSDFSRQGSEIFCVSGPDTDLPDGRGLTTHDKAPNLRGLRQFRYGSGSRKTASVLGS